MGNLNMTDNTYNGWTNYATWRVNLEMIDGLDPREMGWNKLDTYDLSKALEEHAQEILESTAGEGLALDYARAFLSDVNWREIAKHMRDDYELTDEDERADV
jgi:hypothetical protein